jgi:predicted regulator of Ras-like GTPase activity (Roadblock/LC7/MglB family)
LLKQKATTSIATELPEGAAVISTADDNEMFAGLAASLAEIRKLNGVNGYILRSNKSAIIDLIEQEKTSEYAILSTQINESSQEMAKQFNLSDIEYVLVEGKRSKALCMTLGENKIGIFMEKTATQDLIVKRILQ